MIKKSGKRKYLLIAIAVPALLIMAWGGSLLQKTGMNTIAEQPAKPVALSYVDIPEQIDNLGDPNRPHYVKLIARVEVPRPEDVEQVKSNMPELQSMLVTHMRVMKASELHDPADSDRLRTELLARANAAVAPAKISGIFFPEMLVQ